MTGVSLDHLSGHSRFPDTGSGQRRRDQGAVRGDFFWGFGEQAGNQAGRMKQLGQMWVLFPKGAEPALAP